MITVSIIIPYVRPNNIANLKAMIRENAGILESSYEILVEHDEDRIGCPKMVAKMVEKAKGEMICFLGDDTLPQRCFLASAIITMSKFKGGYGLVGLSDCTGRFLPCHWVAHKEMLPHLGGEFFHTGYKHCYCDVELWDRCKEVDRAVMDMEAVVLHHHPLINGAAIDKDYTRVYSDEYLDHDKKLYDKRLANNWFKENKDEREET